MKDHLHRARRCALVHRNGVEEEIDREVFVEATRVTTIDRARQSACAVDLQTGGDQRVDGPGRFSAVQEQVEIDVEGTSRSAEEAVGDRPSDRVRDARSLKGQREVHRRFSGVHGLGTC